MEAVILAGGLGKRLRPLISDVPKPMAPIAGRPFLELLIFALAKKGFHHIVLSVGYMSDVIESHFGEQFAGIQLSYVFEDSPLGTGGATRLALTKCNSDHVFIFNGDTYLDLEAIEIEKYWLINKAPLIVARKIEDTHRYGRLLVQKHKVIGFDEKGISGPGLINAGCYVLDKKSLEGWPLFEPFSLELDYFAQAVKDFEVSFFETEGLFIDIGIPEDFLKAQAILAPQR